MLNYRKYKLTPLLDYFFDWFDFFNHWLFFWQDYTDSPSLCYLRVTKHKWIDCVDQNRSDSGAWNLGAIIWTMWGHKREEISLALQSSKPEEIKTQRTFCSLGHDMKTFHLIKHISLYSWECVIKCCWSYYIWINLSYIYTKFFVSYNLRLCYFKVSQKWVACTQICISRNECPGVINPDWNRMSQKLIDN